MNQLKIFILGSIISAENNEITEEEKQEIISRLDIQHINDSDVDWQYIFEPIKDEEKRNTIIRFMESEITESTEQEDDLLNEIEPVDMEVLKD